MLDLPDMYDEDAIHVFIHGLNEEACMPVLMMDHSTLLATYNSAEQYEGLQEYARGANESGARRNHGHYSQAPIPPAPVVDGPTPMDLDAIRVRPLQYNNRGGSSSFQGQQQHPRRCYNCDGRGHIAHDCPSPRVGGSRSPQKSFNSDLKGKARRD